MDNVKISEEPKRKITALIMQRDISQAQLEIYLKGLQDGLGLEGEWILDIQSWQLAPKKEG